MKKIFKGLICAGLCGVLAIGVAGCNTTPPASEHRDPEVAPLRLAINGLDQKFHPQLYTAQNDGTIASMTQIALMTSDASGTLAYGDDQPTVTLDYQEIYRNASGAVLTTHDGKDDNKLASVNVGTDGSTTYEFLIKNGIKFSDGIHDLTVMDVLFNLYVYLDFVYTGSSTIYSTKIEGLSAYRLQDPDADEDSESESNATARANATSRLNTIREWVEENPYVIVSKDNDGKFSATGNDAWGTHKEEISLIIDLYKEELETDWNSLAGGWVESYKEYNFKEIWQPFFHIEGLITDVIDPATGEYELNADGTRKTTLDTGESDSGVDLTPIIAEIEAAASDEKVQQFIETHPGYSEANAKAELQKNYAIGHLYDSYTDDATGIRYILSYTQTASTTWDEFFLQEKSKETTTSVPRISGITVSHTDSAEYGGKFNGKTYEEDHDILRIKIKGADPKAKWNFSFAVAPMYYYSDEEHYNAAMADYNEGRVYNGTATNFGVECRNRDWFREVLGSTEKTRLPMGAGAYKCSTYNRSDNLNSGTFFYNNTAYFERNEYFTTLGDGVENAKIKYVTYAQTPDDQIVESLTTGTIDYGEPNATPANITKLNTGNLKQIDYATGGYGYIGINPQYVPDIEVRQAIMHAIDTSSIFEYYAEGKVNIINRPVSTTSWAYPENATRYYERWTDTKEIIKLVTKNGQSDKWFDEGGKIVDSSGKQLKLTFTIAGESTDHPAYQVLKDAERFLEQCGFDISVVTDINALKNLATGNLTVWAAAWSSSIDPDPYQIYSLDSQASSTKNWAKEAILTNEGGKFDKELKIATELNALIKEGRETLNRSDRMFIYEQCFDKIMELAVEFPTYQRHDLCVYNSAALDRSSMTERPSYLMGPIGEIWKLTYTP